MRHLFFAIILICSSFGVTAHALQTRDPKPMIGEVRMFAGNFAPRGWALCDGQLLSISQHTALFAIIGTTYGGDGRKTFALPDLRGRVPMHPGAVGASVEVGTLGTVGQGKPVKPSPSGGDAPVTQPSLRINFIICLEGAFPSR